MNKAEYWILRSAVKTHQWLREVAYKCGLSHAEVADAANRLFQNRNIIARVFEHKKDHQGMGNIILTQEKIQANLEGKLRASYELTTQGGRLWEAMAGANWNQYFIWYIPPELLAVDELFEGELIGVDRQLMENILSISSYIRGEVLIPRTEVWEVIEPWQATYWKTLLKAYRVRYQARNLKSIDSYTSIEEYEVYEQAKKWYAQIAQWYRDPEFEKESLNLGNSFVKYDAPTNETATKKAEYFILKRVAEHYGDYYHDFAGVALDYNLSHIETLPAAHSLFQKGDILADVYRDETLVLGVAMTIPEIQANLDGKLPIYYYLTPQGGARWEAMTHPNWNQYYVSISQSGRPGEFSEYQCEIICPNRQLIENILSVSIYIFNDVPIRGTEVWDILKPWQATYWKTLPQAYRVRYQARENQTRINFNNSPDWETAMRQAYQWLDEIQRWYTEPSFE